MNNNNGLMSESEMESHFLYTSESVGEGHPGNFKIILFRLL